MFFFTAAPRAFACVMLQYAKRTRPFIVGHIWAIFETRGTCYHYPRSPEKDLTSRVLTLNIHSLGVHTNV